MKVILKVINRIISTEVIDRKEAIKRGLTNKLTSI